MCCWWMSGLPRRREGYCSVLFCNRRKETTILKSTLSVIRLEHNLRLYYKHVLHRATAHVRNKLGSGPTLMVSQMLQNSTTCTFIFNNIYLRSTRYIYIQQYAFSFNFNPNYFHSTKMFVQLQPKIISFNKNICSTSTRDNYIQQQYICSTSTQIIFIR